MLQHEKLWVFVNGNFYFFFGNLICKLINTFESNIFNGFKFWSIKLIVIELNLPLLILRNKIK